MERSTRAAKKIRDLGQILIKEEASAKYKQVADILKIEPEKRSIEQLQILEHSPEVVKRCQFNKLKRDRSKLREEEKEDSPEVLERKSLEMAAAISRSSHLVVYTGAGISTAADIPDYRGPNGVWTLKEKGITVRTRDLSEAEPTYTHMALAQLVRKGKLKHVVSQNCDGLHIRSGVARNRLSELHGNMFLEVCPNCVERREYMRLFDVTERTGMRKHGTGRLCHHCQCELRDTIIHFGEKGPLVSPYLWTEAREAAETADMILCLGTSLKILKQYACLWCLDRPTKKRPTLYIVNLQWTPKDVVAALKIRGNCDAVMKTVMNALDTPVPPYQRYFDPIFNLHTPLLPEEYSTRTKKIMSRGELKIDHNYSVLLKPDPDPIDVTPTTSNTNSSQKEEDNSKCSQQSQEVCSPGWYGLGMKPSKAKRRKL